MNDGVVVTFDAEKGFGFIRAEGFPADVFVHASAVEGGAPLRAGQRVRFEAVETDRGPRAARVEPGRAGVTPALAGALGMASALVLGTAALRASGVSWFWAWAVAVNLVTPAVYAWDKHHATRHLRRVPEAVLLLLALLGGWPGAALAMAALRHKTRKPRFLIAFAGAVVLDLILILFLIYHR